MTDQTPETPAAAKPSSLLSEDEQRKIEALTARNDPRFKADAQNQALLERAKRIFRAFFMRSDHGRWRVSKTKGIAIVTLGVAVLAFWNYYPKPQFAGAFDTPSVNLPAASSATGTPSETSVPTQVTKPITSSVVPNPIASTPEPRWPAPRLESMRATTPSEPVTSSAPKYNLYQEETVPSALPRTRASVQVSSGFTPSPSFDGNLEPEGIPNTGAIGRGVQRPPARVAPAPTALVQRPAVSARVPKPLVDTGEEAIPDRTTAMTGSAGNAAPTVRALVSADGGRNESRLGQAGALVDTQAAAQSQFSSGEIAPLVSGGTGSDDTINSKFSGALFDTTRVSATTPSNPVSRPNLSTSQSSGTFQIGTRVRAKLIVGVIAVQGQESPVVAQLENGAIAFGKASLNSSGRVQISLLEVVKDGVSSTVNASALGSDGFPGVAVELREDSPDVVGKLWQAGLQGVSSYAQNVIEGATTTIANGATSVTSPQPNFGLSLLQSLAQAFLTPPNQTTVKYARLEPQIAFEVLFMPSK